MSGPQLGAGLALAQAVKGQARRFFRRPELGGVGFFEGTLRSQVAVVVKTVLVSIPFWFVGEFPTHFRI